MLVSGASDEQIATWLDTHGIPKKPAEVKAWSDAVEALRPYDNPEQKDWFAGECAKLGLKPERTTLFDYLEADDRDAGCGLRVARVRHADDGPQRF